jgi:signal transduction histidine kinase/ligand-binding sensor domain-containing protein
LPTFRSTLKFAYSGLSVRYFCICLLLSFSSSLVMALDPELNVSQYAHSAWLVQDGYFQSAPRVMTQTADGYLWIGTDTGLLRFDGVKFLPWAPPDGTPLPSNVIFSLLGARDGSLWIGTGAGLVHVVDGKAFEFPNFNEYVVSILEDPAGHIWISRDGTTDRKSPLCEVLGSTIRCLDKSDGVSLITCCGAKLSRDAAGSLWIGSDRYLLRWRAGSSSTYLPNGLSNAEGMEGESDVAPAADGSVWVGMIWTGKGRGLQNLQDGKWKPLLAPGFNSESLSVIKLLTDRDGSLWVGTAGLGIYHIHDRRVDRFTTANGLSSDTVVSFYEDREGVVWAVTARGIDSFHRPQVITFSKQEGLAIDNVVSVVVSKDDSVWLANGPSLTTIKNSRVTAIVRSGNGLPGNAVTSLFADQLGRLWVGVDNDLFLYERGQFHRVHRKDGGSSRFIVGMTEDPQHDIWAEVSGSNRELIRIHGLSVVEEYPEASVPSARLLAADSHGSIWLGLRDGDLARFRNGRAEVISFPHSPDAEVRQVIANSDDSVFGTTAVGLIAVRNDKSQTLTSRNGLPCDGVIGATWDNMGALWLATKCGLVRIEASDVRKWWANPNAVLQPKVFDVFDGFQPGIPDFNPAAKSSDGKLWFANQHVLQMIDPSHLLPNEVKAPVHIEQIVADRQIFSPTQGLRLPPLMRDLEIDYAGLSFVNPRRVRFRYELEGRDTRWQDAGTRRQALYNDLRPGNYRFHVVSCNGDGIWDEQGAFLDFSVAPTWYQMNAFRAFCVLSGILILWLLYQLRLRQITQATNARIDERLAERTRLARELHDTFLQTLQGSKLVTDGALDRSSDPAYVRQSLEKLSVWIDRAMREGRSALNSLRGSTLTGNDLRTSFQLILNESELHGFEEGTLTVNGDVIPMHPIITHEIYRIGYEAIHNAYQHSGGTQLELHLTFSNDFTLIVRDNGLGIDSKLAAEGREGHFGLQSMRERAARIDAQFQLITASRLGTTIEVKIPGKIAFRKKGGRTWADLFEKAQRFVRGDSKLNSLE